MERILQSTTRAGEEKTGGGRKKENEERGNKRVNRSEREIIIKLAELFDSEGFSYFLDILNKKESFDLQELIRPMLKSDKLSNNEYTFLIRGRLEVYEEIREEIKKVKSLAEKYAIQN